MFRKVESALIFFYVASVVLLLSLSFIALHRLGMTYMVGIILVVGVISIGIGVMLARMALAPLKEHFDHLETFSKETLHELNLPISTIQTNVNMLRKTHTDEKSLKRLERVELATHMLQERYNELDYLIKKQMERESIERVDLALIVQKRITFLEALYPNAVWTTVLDSTWCQLDPIGLGKVIDNLVDNSVKYSQGSATIRITLKNHVLSICDDGIGMDEVTLMRVYERYYQNDSTMAGFGIGLHLVKRFCDRHKIAMKITSTLGQGTCVALEFKPSV